MEADIGQASGGDGSTCGRIVFRAGNYVRCDWTDARHGNRFVSLYKYIGRRRRRPKVDRADFLMARKCTRMFALLY